MLSIHSTSWQDFSRLSRIIKQPVAVPADYARLMADYCCCSCRLASFMASERNTLLQEWCLRYTLFTLADVAVDTRRQTDVREACLNNLYVPLRALIRLYRQQPNGQAEIIALHTKLHHSLALIY